MKYIFVATTAIFLAFSAQAQQASPLPDDALNAYESPAAEAPKAASATPAPAPAEEATAPKLFFTPGYGIKEYEGVHYLTGGVGEEEMALLKSEQTSFNAKFMFTIFSGAYLSDVSVTIYKEKDVVFQAAGTGPYLYIALPAGKYKMEAKRGDKVKTLAFTAPEKGGYFATVRWEKE